MQEIKENINKYECNETETDANRTDTHTRLSGSIKLVFSKCKIYYSKFKKKKEFQCQKQVSFQNSKWFGFGA